MSLTAVRNPRYAAADVVPVVLVDDHPISRAGVRALIEGTEFTVVGEASSGREALEVVRQTRPRIVLLDIRMAGGDGLEALAALKREHPRIAALMLTTYDDPELMARAVSGGAAGYLLKGVCQEDLVRALRAVALGDMLLGPDDLRRSLERVTEGSTLAALPCDEPFEPLTPREQEVLRLLATGRSNRQIAALLFVAESTVKTHLQNITAKLGVSDRVQAAVWAARHGYCQGAG
jgi:DNA-binding NarL/FixJ family response regulator